MAIHNIKIERPYYDAVINGDKTFEIRYNDRGYQKGDLVIMECVNSNGLATIGMNHIEATISYVSTYQQKENWCVFGLVDIMIGER